MVPQIVAAKWDASAVRDLAEDPREVGVSLTLVMPDQNSMPNLR